MNEGYVDHWYVSKASLKVGHGQSRYIQINEVQVGHRNVTSNRFPTSWDECENNNTEELQDMVAVSGTRY